MRISLALLLLPLVLLPAPPPASLSTAGRHFLTYDTRGDGLAVEVLGDLGAADRIAVLVPGVDTTLRDFDRGLGGVARRAPAVQARTLYAHLRTADPAAHVAVVAWLGYDPPEGISLQAARDARARTGAAALITFVRALPAQARVTLIGHSYGALVVGLAAPHLSQATDLVALGA
ncbi:MAG: alpha/beta hydrolase, partial [Actinoplanes sp.]